MKSSIVHAADLFCGAGGTSTGLIEACHDLGYAVDLTAINHWDIAIATHSSNHPGVRHLCASLETLNPRTLFGDSKLEIMWASPECMHHSIARGGKPINDQSRSTAWHVVQWAEALRPQAIIVENVKEFLTWGPIGTNGRPLQRRKGEIFRSWVKCLEAIGYKVDWRILCAADFGDPTTRERLFIQAVRGRAKLAWPVPSHAQSGRDGDIFGSIKHWVPARDIIDWTLQGGSIFERKKPLSEKTLRRIWAGLEKFGLKAFVVQPGHGDAEGRTQTRNSIDEPLRTVAGSNRFGVVEPFVMAIDQTGGNSKCINSISDPLTTITTKQRHAIVQPYIVKHHGQSNAQSIDDPVSAVTTKQKHSLAEPFLVKLRGTNTASDISKPSPTVTASGGNLALAEPFLVQVNHGDGNGDGSKRRTKSVDAPLPTVCGKGGEFALVEPSLLPQQSDGRLRPVSEPAPTIATDGAIGLVQPFLIQFNTKDRQLCNIDNPLGTVTTKSRFGLARPVVMIDGEKYLLDIRFRMLQPHELAGAQGFPKEYKFSGNKTEIIKQIGNAVPKNLAKALCRAILTELRRKRAA